MKKEKSKIRVREEWKKLNEKSGERRIEYKGIDTEMENDK